MEPIEPAELDLIAALRESEEKYRTLFESMEQGFAVCELVRDAAGRAVDYRYVELNSALVRHVGLTPDALRGRRATEVFSTVDPWLIETYERLVDTRESVKVEHYFAHVNRWLRFNAIPRDGDRFAVFYSDITDQKRTEEALRDSERRYRLLFENMGEGFALGEMIWDADGRPVDWRYLNANAQWAQTGVAASDTIGRTAREVDPQIEPYWIETYGRVVQTGEPVAFESYAKGSGKWFDTIAFKHSDNCFGLIVRDSTARRQLNAERREYAERQAFLLELSDALKPLAGAAEIQGEATRLLREHLAAGWCYYVEWDDAAARGTVLRDATRDGLPSLAGTHDVSDVPAFLNMLRAKSVLNVGDYANFEALTPALRARYTALGFRSMLVATLVKQGRLVASLLVGDTEVRHWSAQEEALLTQAAERTWAAVERARAEAALRVSEARYRTIFESIDEGFAVAEVLYDAEGRPVDLLYLEANPAASRLTGGTAFAGRRLSEVLPEADRTSLEIYDTVARTGRPERVERYYASFDRWFEGHISPVTDVARHGTHTIPRTVAIVFRDVTERRRAEQTLRESEARYRTLFENMGQGYSDLELVRDPDGRIVDERLVTLNPAFERIFGIPLERAIGHRRSEIFPGLEPWWEESFDRVARSGVPERVEYESPSIGGWYEMWVYPRGGDQLTVLYEDITERKRADAVLREREERHAFLLSLSDALRAEPNEDAIATRALGMLAERLQADRCYVGVYHVAEDRGEHGPQVGNDRVAPVPSVVRLSDFPEAVRIASDATLVFDDVAAANGLTEVDRRNLGAVGIRALVVATLRRHQREPFWSMIAVSADPRRWTAGEVALVEETAERTWAAIERARAEAALRASEEQFRRSIEDAPIPVIMHAEDGEVLQVSRTWTELTGYTPEEVPTFDAWLTRAYGQGADAVREHVRALFTGSRRTMSFEFPVRTRGGETRHWSFSASAPGTLRDGRRFVVGMALDVTERRRAEEALRASEHELRLVTESMPALISYVDVGLRYRFANRFYEDWFGSRPEDIIGMHLQEFVGDAAFERLRPHIDIVLSGRRHSFEAEVPFKAGGTRHVHTEFVPDVCPDGAVAGYYALVVDVTARYQAEQALAASEERLRAVIDSLRDYAIMTLDRDGRITTWNDGARKITGYQAEEVLGRTIDLFYTAEDIASAKPAQELRRAIDEGRSEDESWRVRKDGSRVWVNEIVRPLRDGAGGVSGFAKISRDLTERKAAEVTLQQAHDTLESRVRERTAQVQSLFARLISAQEEERRRIARDIHDHVGQQMTALRINLESLHAQAGRRQALAQQVERIQHLAEELDQSIDFLTWQLRPAALDHLGLAAALQNLAAGWSQRFSIAAEYVAHGVADLRLPHDVEANLYRIAQEALHNVAKHAQATQVTIQLTRRDGELMMVIEDNGAGFDPDAAASASDGRGMGLINMRERAALAGGRLDIESSAGHGTSIYVRVPLTQR